MCSTGCSCVDVNNLMSISMGIKVLWNCKMKRSPLYCSGISNVHAALISVETSHASEYWRNKRNLSQCGTRQCNFLWTRILGMLVNLGCPWFLWPWASVCPVLDWTQTYHPHDGIWTLKPMILKVLIDQTGWYMFFSFFPPYILGQQCQNNINDCADSPCDSVGSIRCVDLLDDYRCDCRDGYMTKNCSVCHSQ